MLEKKQISLVQMAAKGAGLRGDRHSPDRRYYFLLRQYKLPSGKPVESSKQLNRDQMEDFLAICESLGWVHPVHGEGYYQKKLLKYSDPHRSNISFAQQEAIRHLSGDLGMTTESLNKFIGRMTHGQFDTLTLLSDEHGWKIIEALKAMLGRRDGKKYETVADAAAEYHHEEHEEKIGNRQ